MDGWWDGLAWVTWVSGSKACCVPREGPQRGFSAVHPLRVLLLVTDRTLSGAGRVAQGAAGGDWRV